MVDYLIIVAYDACFFYSHPWVVGLVVWLATWMCWSLERGREIDAIQQMKVRYRTLGYDRYRR